MKQYSFLTEFYLYKKGIQLYHVSQLNLDNQTLKPRIPNSAGTFLFDDKGKLIRNGEKSSKKVEEDNKTPRVCFGRSLKGCFNAVPNIKTRKVWFVHVPVNIDPKYIKHIGFDEVPDSETSHEIWYTKPVKLKCIGIVYVYNFYWRGDSLSKHGFPRVHVEYESINKKYDPPYNFYQVKYHYGKDILEKICGCYMDDKKGYVLKNDATPNQKAHFYRCQIGIEITHKEPTLTEQNRTFKNWLLMTDKMKKQSDELCKQLFGKDNVSLYKELIKRTDYNDYKTGQLEIDFPKEEISKLSKQNKFVTTRVDEDYNKYWYGDIVMTPWGKKYKIVKRENFKDIKKHPYYNELTKDQIKFISKYDKYCVLWGIKL